MRPKARRWGLLALAAACALLASCAAKQPEAPAALADSPAAPPSHGERPGPLLWQALGPEAGDGALFLLGSIHVGRPDAGDLGGQVAQVFAACDELVVEVDLSALSAEEVARETAAYAVLPPGQTLRSLLSDETWALLASRLRDQQTPVAAVDNFKPWAVASFLAMQDFEAAGLEADYGVDRQFMDRASGRLPIRGLETLQSQLEMLDGLAPEIQEQMLAEALLRVEDTQADSAALLLAWERGDAAELARLLFAPQRAHPELAPFYEAVFFARNEAMVARLVDLVGDGKRRFVVLGAGHMLGPRGVPALLASRGFRVERLGGR